MKTKSIRDGFMPWAGLARGTTRVLRGRQNRAESKATDCTVGSPWIVVFGTVVGLAVVGLGALGSWRVYGAGSEPPARRLVAIVGLLACALYTLGILLPFVAALIIPPCWA